jgi:hypothetical protein
MHRTRLSLLAALIGISLSLGAPLVAHAAETETTMASTESSVAQGGAPAKPPAVSIVEEAAPEELQPWTVRYLVPTSVLIAGLLIFGTVVQYFLQVVRTRYKTVE